MDAMMVKLFFSHGRRMHRHLSFQPVKPFVIVHTLLHYNALFLFHFLSCKHYR